MKKYLLVAAVTVTMVLAACNSNRSKIGSEPTTNVPVAKTTVSNDQHALLPVGGSCEMCKDRIEKVANEIPGVTLATYNLENKQLHFHFDGAKTTVETVSKAIAASGHDTDKDKAPDEVYNALPACCKYREP